ncbi:hypothetical protein EB796_013304 [Bugula neritina]|uniref:Uncharacterized protein n=1 Tax=Bugula neritina TaxID=10212 RepID=A0A7J7JR39_BUGNE|nr:hypothetical protein EB796_013304 [Bugula neritina]
MEVSVRSDLLAAVQLTTIIIAIIIIISIPPKDAIIKTVNDCKLFPLVSIIIILLFYIIVIFQDGNLKRALDRILKDFFPAACH